MNILPKKEEELLQIILNKYDGNENMEVNGTYDEMPTNMHLGLKNIFRTLEIYNYIGHYEPWLNGWSVVLNQEGIEYFEKKGMRQELFEELADNEKELLKEIIETDERNENINELIEKKLKEDKKDIIKGITGVLNSNGLVNVFWASNIPYRVSLTNSGRTYFEREEKYIKRMELQKNNTYNFGDISIDRGNFVAGYVVNSVLNVDSHITQIEKDIEEKADDDDKENLKEILEDAKK